MKYFKFQKFKLTKFNNNIKIILGGFMKTKEKNRLILGTILVITLIIIYIGYNIYINKLISYASNEKMSNNELKISNAEKIEIEKVINENQNGDKEQIVTEEIELEYITEYRENDKLSKGNIQVIQEGRTGIQQITVKVKYNENDERQEELINSIITKAPVKKIVEVGTSKYKSNYKVSVGSILYVTSDRADIMEENNIQSRKITTITKNTEMEVLYIDGAWYKVSINRQIGWIKSENVASNQSSNSTKIQNSNKIKSYNFNMSLNEPSGLTLEQFKQILNDSKDVNNVFRDNAEYFYYIEQQYNINGVFVAAIGIHESAWGTSKISLNKKNLFGYGTYDSSPSSSSYIFDTYSEGIDLIARVLTKHYLNPKGTSIYEGEVATGKYYSGNTLSDVNKKYASDSKWADKVYNCMEYLYKKI